MTYGTLRDRMRKLSAETLGTAALALAIVGSGANAVALTGDAGLALLINATVTAAVLAVLITLLIPVSGAHFNPGVTLVMALRGNLSWPLATGYMMGQVLGALLGTALAHWLATGSVPVVSEQQRIGPDTFASEVVATAGLLVIIVSSVIRNTPTFIPAGVALWIGAGYFVTPSTGFANPAITIGRIVTDTFTGIEPVSAGWFVGAQIIGALVGFGLAIALHHRPGERETTG